MVWTCTPRFQKLALHLDTHVLWGIVWTLRASASPAAQWGHQLFWRTVKKMKRHRPEQGPCGARSSFIVNSLKSLIWILFPYGLLRIQSSVNIFFFNLSLKICFKLTKITEWKGRGRVGPGLLPFCYVLYTLWNSPRPSAHEISYTSSSWSPPETLKPFWCIKAKSKHLSYPGLKQSPQQIIGLTLLFLQNAFPTKGVRCIYFLCMGYSKAFISICA